MDHEGDAIWLLMTMMGGQIAGLRRECHDIELQLAADHCGLAS